MKKLLHTAALLAALALAGCAPQTDTTPVWQTTLPASGAAVSVANCTVAESTAAYTDADGVAAELTLLTTDGAPLLCLPADAVLDIDFASPAEGGGYTVCTEGEPIEKADYVLGTDADGATACRLDTVYSFLVSVTTEAGTDRLLFDCRR